MNPCKTTIIHPPTHPSSHTPRRVTSRGPRCRKSAPIESHPQTRLFRCHRLTLHLSNNSHPPQLRVDYLSAPSPHNREKNDCHGLIRGQLHDSALHQPVLLSLHAQKDRHLCSQTVVRSSHARVRDTVS